MKDPRLYREAVASARGMFMDATDEAINRAQMPSTGEDFALYYAQALVTADDALGKLNAIITWDQSCAGCAGLLDKLHAADREITELRALLVARPERAR